MSAFGFTSSELMNVIIPIGVTSGHFHRVTATASRIKRLALGPVSLRNKLFTHAPDQRCFVYSANGQLVVHNAPASAVSRTRHLPGGTNCGVPGFWWL